MTSAVIQISPAAVNMTAGEVYFSDGTTGVISECYDEFSGAVDIEDDDVIIIVAKCPSDGKMYVIDLRCCD